MKPVKPADRKLPIYIPQNSQRVYTLLVYIKTPEVNV